MKILICSDGTQSTETAIHLGGSLAGPIKADTTLLGIAETSQDEQPLRDALYSQAQSLQGRGVSPAIVVQSANRCGRLWINVEDQLRPGRHWCALDRNNRALLALGKNLRSNQSYSAPWAGGHWRMQATEAFSWFALAVRNLSIKPCSLPASWQRS